MYFFPFKKEVIYLFFNSSNNKFLNFFSFFGANLDLPAGSGFPMRIWIPNTDPDPLTQLYPDPEHWFRIHNSLNSGPGSLVNQSTVRTTVPDPDSGFEDQKFKFLDQNLYYTTVCTRHESSRRSLNPTRKKKQHKTSNLFSMGLFYLLGSGLRDPTESNPSKRN